ncbi:MAG: glycoside hydrolase family 3 N-terminal domain-containing protein [Lachnospiraceae bacterium]|nr:glycoside hydrolase family 3 N-terminal domain-containing protein [Lachnospiraceae bacterium]
MEKYKNPQLSVEERAEDLLGRMTLEEKAAQMDMIRGVELATKVHEAHFCAVDEHSDFYWDKVKASFGSRGMGFVHDVYSAPQVLNRLQRYLVEETRLGIPCIFTGEALHGLSYPGATIFPMPINLGAAFDPELTREVGHAIAAETRSLGIHEILAPNLDLAREPRWGRVEETFGEDTYLSSQMAYAIVTGEQGDDISAPDSVMSEPKHFCVHGIPEGGINCSPARAGTREIESAYLPVFEAGIKKAGAYNAMASYNSIDGEAVICSEYYLRTILKERFGMPGYVRADFGAINRLKDTHHLTGSNEESIQRAVNAGLDVQGFDFSNEEWQQSLVKLVREGGIAQENIDDSVRRILRAKFALGLFEHPYTDEDHYRDVVRCEKHRSIARKAAEESIVLLQNKNQILPLSKEIKSVAVIGPSSAKQRVGSYASVPYGYTVSNTAAEIRKKVSKDCLVLQADGCGITEQDVEVLPKSWFVDGVSLEFYENAFFDGIPVGSDKASQITFNWILAKPHRALPFKGYSVRMRAKLQIHTHEFSEKASFLGKLVFTTNDSVRVFIDGVPVIESCGENKQRLPQCEMEFADGAEHDLMIEYVCDVNGADLALCVDCHTQDMERAIEAAKLCDVTVLVCGDDEVTSGEGMDRSSLKLYGAQQELIRRVSMLGKPVILVLEHGKPVDLAFETEHMDAILAAWFGGEQGAEAIADVLFGDVNPSGKLPISFPMDIGQLPCYYSMLPGGAPSYLEGERKARFAFGHGCSYTEFTYGNLQIIKESGQYEVTVSAQVTNSGSVRGTETVQLYVEDVCSSIVTPGKLLQGFQRLSLEAGETREVRFQLGFDNFRLLNHQMEWVVEPGVFRIMVGGGSADIRLCGEVEL